MINSMQDILDWEFPVEGGLQALIDSFSAGTDVTVKSGGRTLTFRVTGLEHTSSLRVLIHGTVRNTAEIINHPMQFLSVFNPPGQWMAVVA